MKRLFFLFCLVTLSASAKVRTTEKDYADTIHIKYENGQILVPITIEGHTYDFLWDTGANMSCIPDSLAQTLFVKEKSSRSVRDFDKNKYKVTRGLLAEATVGNLHMTGLDCMTAPGGGFILGAYQLWISGFSSKIDLLHGILILTDRRGFLVDEKAHKLPEKDFSFLTQLKYSLSHGASGTAEFDTGYNGYFAISKKKYEESVNGVTGQQFLEQELWRDSVSYMGAHGVQNSLQSFLWIEGLQMGDITFRSVPVNTTDNYSGFGCRMLEYGAFTMERKGLCSYFQPFIGDTIVQMIQPKPQLNFGLTGDNFTVRAIDVRSSLYSAGVRMGDTLVQIGGEPATTVSEFAVALQKLDVNKSCPLRFRHPDGQEIDATVGPQTYGYFFHM